MAWLQHMEEREMGGVCEGKLQRRGDRPLRCRKLDLEELHFTVSRKRQEARSSS